MINVSNACKKAIHENSKTIVKANIDFANGTRLELTGADFIANTLNFSQASSSSGSFEIGAAVIGKASFTLNNSNGKFDAYDFTDAVITIWIGIPLSSSVEWIKKGVFTVEQPDTYGPTIALSAYDNLSKFEKPYSEVTTPYPATLQVIVSDICLHCGVQLKNARFDNYTLSIPSRPDTDTISCLDIISYVAQISGSFAVCDTDGRLLFKWYDMGMLNSVQVDNGEFHKEIPYEADIDGGVFTDNESTVAYDGGNFADEYVVFRRFAAMSVCTDDVVITGISIIAGGDEEESCLYGNDDYALEISGNALITKQNMETIATFLGEKIVGMRFRPFSLQEQSNPIIEVGDCCYIISREGYVYQSVVTNINYKIGNRTNFSCDAETPRRNKAAYYSELAKTTTKNKKEMRNKLSNYDKAVQQMNQLAVNAMGFYETYEDLEDGSRITYMHDKPTIAESRTVYKQSIDGFFLSQDGGKTYTYGRDSNGNEVVNILAAIGILFDWAKGGTLTLGGDNNTDGVCTVLNASGKEVARLDKNGLKTNSAEITGGKINISTNSADDSIILIRNKSGSVNKYTLMSASMFSAYSSGYGSINVSVSGVNLHNGRNTTLDINSTRIALNEYGFKIEAYSTTSSVRFTNSSYITVTNNTPSIVLGAFKLLQLAPSLLCDMYIGNVKISGGGNSGISSIKLGSIELYSATGGDACRLRNVTVEGFLSVTGSKSRIAETENYSNRLLYCYEMPKPYFGDIGEAVLDDNGLCYVFIDDIFYETVNTECRYQVFLQKYGQGDIWIKERSPTHFIAEGTPGLSFGWEIKARQSGFEMERFESFSEPERKETIDYESEAQRYVENYYKEMLEV